MKTLEFIFQETQIHFLLKNEGNVMVNATEMAKAFNKRVDHFRKSDHAKAFIHALKLPPNGGSLSDENIISFRGRNGIYFHRALALKFAAWLDPYFEVWVFNTLESLLFGNYQKHWEAHAQQEVARVAMEDIKTEILHNPTPESVAEYFRHERDYKACKNAKTKAIRSQLRLFQNFNS